MARKLVISDAEPVRYGLRITDPTGRVGWIAGADGDYLLFDTRQAAEKALKKLKQNDNYSWNCTAEAVEFAK